MEWREGIRLLVWPKFCSLLKNFLRDQDFDMVKRPEKIEGLEPEIEF